MNTPPTLKWDRAHPVPPFVEVSVEDPIGTCPNVVFGYDHIREHYYLRVYDIKSPGCETLYRGHYVSWMCSPSFVYFRVRPDDLEKCAKLATAFNQLDTPLHHAYRMLACGQNNRVPDDERDYDTHESLLKRFKNQLPKNP
jgi:hypothetical protein